MLANLNKTEPDTRIIDKLYDPSGTSGYELYLYSGDDGMSMAVMDPAEGGFIALQSYSFSPGKQPGELNSRLRDFFDDDTFISNKNYRQVVFMHAGSKATLVPDPLFDPGSKSGYLDFNFTVNQGEHVFSDALKLLGAHNVYAVPDEIQSTVRSHFPNAIFRHYASPFIESLLLNNKNRDEKIITVHVHLSGFEMAVTRRNELLFYNSFRYTSTEDFLYYVLFTMEQLQLNPETTPFIFTGSAERSSALYITTQKYIRFVGFGERTPHFSFAGSFEEIPAHFHYILFNGPLCVS